MTDIPAQRLLKELPNQLILVLGDVMLDEYIVGDVRRISPEAPVPVVEICSRTHIPGGAANVAVNISSLGGRALLGGLVGDDPPGEKLRETVRQRGVEPSGLVTDHGRLTTIKTRVIAHSQQVVRLDAENRSPLSPELADRLLAWVNNHLDRVGACVISDYGKGVASPPLVQKVIGLARRAGKPVIVDPKSADPAMYRGATVMKPNVREVERFMNCEIRDEQTLLHAGRRLANSLEGTAIVVSRGAQGMSLFRNGAVPVHINALSRQVFDVTGAGDSVIAMLAVSLAAGLSLEEGIRLGNIAAGIVIGKVGTAAVTPDELAKALHLDSPA